MKLLLLANEATGLGPTQATTALAANALARGHQVYCCGVTDLALRPDGRVWAHALVLEDTHGDAAALSASLGEARQESVALEALDLVFVRTNPGRDTARATAHSSALELLRISRDQGVPVLNDPDGLQAASTKLFLARLPGHTRPRTLVSSDKAELRAFVHDAPGPTVLKPVSGTQGRDVFRMHGQDSQNLPQVLDVLVRQGLCMAQDYVPEARDGDVRVIMVDGELLEVDGQPAIVRRRPGKGEWRSNVAQGGAAEPAELDGAMRRTVRDVGPALRRAGLFLVGLDLIGDKVVEVNGSSPGGLVDASNFQGVDFVSAIVAALEARIG